MYWLHGDDLEDTDQFDLAIWALDDAAIDPDGFGEYLPYNLLSIDRGTLYGGKSHYLFRGYPSGLRTVDYESGKFQLDSISGHALYVGKVASASTHELALVNVGTLSSAEGLSGAPVFQVNNSEASPESTESFAGILIRGNASRAYFLEHRRIIGAMIQISAGEYQPVNPPRGARDAS